MKLVLWTNKLLFLITKFFFASFCVIINFIDLSFNDVKYEIFMTHENPYSWLCKLFMVHENNW